MDDLDLFRDFRSGVAAPSEDARRRAAARLQGAIEGKHRHGVGAMLLVRRRSGRTVLALAALAVVVGTALFVSAPWKNSPGFLERAQAALTPPAGTVLHMRWELGFNSIDPACVFTRSPTGTGWISRGPHESWIDQTPPHRFRTIMAWADGSGECGSEAVKRDESGGDFDSGEELFFVPPDTLAVWPLGKGGRPPDPVKELRTAISAGRAHREGRTQLDGRIVERIRVDPPANCPKCSREPSYTYVDPDTFYLVRRESPSLTARAGGAVVQFRIVERYLTYEYLPRTAANVKLANIRAQHPDITP
jgi:hypothetical protein